MEQVWKTRGCACPNHVTQWFDREIGYRFYNEEKTGILLWFKRGQVRRTRGKKPKGKGFSHLAKNYGLISRVKWGTRKHEQAISSLATGPVRSRSANLGYEG